MSYQWRLNGTNIAGATSACYSIASTTVNDVGRYTVVVSNYAGMVTSTAAGLALVDLKMFAGLIITGTVGTHYRIEFTTTLNNPVWAALATVTLPASQYIYIDYGSPSAANRYYRAVPLP
jgi:hypothetical protein